MGAVVILRRMEERHRTQLEQLGAASSMSEICSLKRLEQGVPLQFPVSSLPAFVDANPQVGSDEVFALDTRILVTQCAPSVPMLIALLPPPACGTAVELTE
jgi:hypothetical protein